MLVAVVLAAALLGVAAPGWAHPRPAISVEAPLPVELAEPLQVSAVVTASAPTPAFPVGLALLLMVVGLAAAIVAPRRALALALMLVLSVLAIESGVHSVHHLGDGPAAAQCAVAWVSGHTHGAAQPDLPHVAWMTTPVGATPVADVAPRASRSLRPDEGRAPPAA